MPTSHEIRAFLLLAETLHFAKTAKALHMSASGLPHTPQECGGAPGFGSKARRGQSARAIEASVAADAWPLGRIEPTVHPTCSIASLSCG